MPGTLRPRFLFGESVLRSSGHPGSADVPPRDGFAPPVDVCETAEAYELRLEIAGVVPSEVEVLVAEDGRTVTVRGERHVAPEWRRGRFLNLEIQYGRFSRRVVLPARVDRDAASARYADGFLVMKLPKLPQAVRRRIPVGNGSPE